MNHDKNQCKDTIKTETTKRNVMYSGQKLLLKIHVWGTERLYVCCRCNCHGKLRIAVYRRHCTRKCLKIQFLSHYNITCLHTDVCYSTIFTEIIAFYLKKSFLYTKTLWTIDAVFNTFGITVLTTSRALMQYRVIWLTVGTIVPTTALSLMQYRLLPLQLAPLCQQQHYLWCNTGYFPYRWHHCASNSTSSDAIPVTSLTVGTIVPATALSLMQYRLLPLQLTPMCQQQH